MAFFAHVGFGGGVSGGDKNPTMGVAVTQSTQITATPATARASEIRGLLMGHRQVGGGHGPIPFLVINATTLTKVQPQLRPDDAPALLLLLLDSQANVRAAALRLLLFIEPHAHERIALQLARETDKLRQDRLRQAALEIDVIRAQEKNTLVPRKRIPY
jgi:hypothetical protein